MALEAMHVPYEHKDKPKPKEKVVNNTADHYGLDDFAVVDAIIGDGSWGAKSTCTPVNTFDKQVADFAARNPDVTNEPTWHHDNNMFQGKFNSFSFTSKVSQEDMQKFINALEPGKMHAVSGDLKFTVCENGLAADRTITLPQLEPEGSVVIWSPDAPLQIRGPIRGGGIAYGDHDPEPPSAEGDLIYAVASDISEGDTVGPLWTRRSIGRGRSIINRELPSLEKIMDETRRLKKHYDKWIKFEQVTGHWNKTIKAAMRGNKKAIANMNKLRNRQVCIMGTAWKGDHWGPDPDTVCSACERLGNDMLHSFTRSTPESTYYPTVMERFEEYKIMFEWHWNTAHADNR